MSNSYGPGALRDQGSNPLMEFIILDIEAKIGVD